MTKIFEVPHRCHPKHQTTAQLPHKHTMQVTQPAIALHPTPLVEEVVTLPQPTPEDQQQTEVEQPASSTSEIVLIVFVALLAVGICVALFLPHSKKDVFDKDI